jgi:LuxR family transcriptional regulator, maltose regulon positive regulatory protein
LIRSVFWDEQALVGGVLAGSAAAERSTLQGTRFARAKFQPPTLPATLVTRSVLLDLLTAGAGQRLTVIVGSAGAGKSVVLSSWAAARPPNATAWLSCDRADVDPVRFWLGFIEATRTVAPEFGADAADLLAMDGAVSADLIASIANDAAKLPADSAVVVDDFHYAATAASAAMTDLVERWPAQAAQLVLAGRSDPPLRLHRWRMAGELCELRDRDLYFTLAESGHLLANFGVGVATADLVLLHQRSEGWPAALQMVALSLRGATDRLRMARALDVRSHAIAEYFIAEVLDQQPAEVAQFMLDTSVLGELTADACAAVTGRPDAAALLHSIDSAQLFLMAVGDDGTIFRYHHLVHQVLRAELRARDRAREQQLQLQAAEWFESTGDTRRAARHFLAAHQADRALTLMQEGAVPRHLQDPVLPAPLELSMVAPALLADAPDRLLALAADLLTCGDTARGGEYLDLLEGAQTSIPPESRLAARVAAMRSFHHAQIGRLNEAVAAALDARAIQERTQLTDEWNTAVPMVLMRAYSCLEDYAAVEREAAAALAIPALPEPAKLVLVPGARALAWLAAGRVAEAAEAASASEKEAQRLGFEQHFIAVHYLRALAGLALERRDLDTAEQLTERVLSITERRRPLFEFQALLDRSAVWAARGQVRDALASVEAARLVLGGGASPALLGWADELEALLRLSLGDARSPTELASGLPAARRGLLLARVALATGDYHGAQEQLRSLPPCDLTPRHALVRQILLTAAAIGRGDPMTAGTVSGVIESARHGGFLNTVVTTTPQLTSYLVEHAPQRRADPFTQQLIAAALEVRATQPDASQLGHVLVAPLSPAEMRILKLLPTSTYPQMAATLYISRNTVKTRLRSVYQKLGVTSRSAAIERAIDLRLL